MADTILVTGALGNVGSAVVQALSAAGYAPRAADLSVTQLRARHGEMVEAVALDQTRRGMSGVVTGGGAPPVGRPPVRPRQVRAGFRAVWAPPGAFQGGAAVSYNLLRLRPRDLGWIWVVAVS